MAPPKQPTARPAPEPEASFDREVIPNNSHVQERTTMPPAALSDKERAKEFSYANQKQVHSMGNPREKRENNLPKPGKFSAMMEPTHAPEAPKAPKVYKWSKFGVQRVDNGTYTLHVEHFEGDKKMRETVRTGLTALGAREAAALQLAAFWATFG